jgi:hypothetical protein
MNRRCEVQPTASGIRTLRVARVGQTDRNQTRKDGEVPGTLNRSYAAETIALGSPFVTPLTSLSMPGMDPLAPRQAGAQHETMTTATKNTADPANVGGSTGEIPNRTPFISLCVAHTQTKPNGSANHGHLQASFRTSHRTPLTHGSDGLPDRPFIMTGDAIVADVSSLRSTVNKPRSTATNAERWFGRCESGASRARCRKWRRPTEHLPWDVLGRSVHLLRVR